MKLLYPPIPGIANGSKTDILATWNDGTLKMQYGTCTIMLPSEMKECYIKTSFYNSRYDSEDMFSVNSDSHNIHFGGSGCFVDSEKICDNAVTKTEAQVFTLHIKPDKTNGLVEFGVDGKEKAGTKAGDIFGGEAIKTIKITPRQFETLDLSYIIVSDSPISPLSKVIAVTPTVTTDWEKGTDGVYTTTDIGKKMALSVDASTVTGYDVQSIAPVLTSCVNGGSVASIVTTTSGYTDTDKLTDIASAHIHEATTDSSITVTSEG